jgi:predicted dehydrogenase
MMVGHSARLLNGTRRMKQAIESGELGTLCFMEANFSNERALELTPDTWRWYKDKAPGGRCLSCVFTSSTHSTI